MFSNSLIRSLCSSSDEHNLRLSKQDWGLVLEANKEFVEAPSSWRGSSRWGRYLCSKLGRWARNLEFEDSLELCCGNGFLFFSLKSDFNLEQQNCSYIDLSNWQCEKFAERCQKANIEPPRIICGDIGKLPFEENSLNLVYGHSFLHHLPDVREYLSEANRVLAPGGKFVAFHEPSPTAVFWETFPRALFKRIEMKSLTDIWLLKPDVITKVFREAGFKKVVILPNGLIASLLVTPWQMISARRSGVFHSESFITPRLFCDSLERFVPRSLLMRYAPSIAIYAEK